MNVLFKVILRWLFPDSNFVEIIASSPSKETLKVMNKLSKEFEEAGKQLENAAKEKNHRLNKLICFEKKYEINTLRVSLKSVNSTAALLSWESKKRIEERKKLKTDYFEKHSHRLRPYIEKQYWYKD